MYFFFQAEDGIRDYKVTGVQTCALPIWHGCDPETLGDGHAARRSGRGTNDRAHDADPQRGRGTVRRHPDHQQRPARRARQRACVEGAGRPTSRGHDHLRSHPAGAGDDRRGLRAGARRRTAQHGAASASGRGTARPRARLGARKARPRSAPRDHRREPRRCVRSAHTTARGAAMMTHALAAVLVREAKIRATNSLFIFWDLVYPLGYLLLFGIGVHASLGFTSRLAGVEYNAFFLAGVLGMASFGIASNTSWSFFLDRDNGVFYEVLTYPIRRFDDLLGKVLFHE